MTDYIYTEDRKIGILAHANTKIGNSRREKGHAGKINWRIA